MGEDHSDSDWVIGKIRVSENEREIHVDVVIQLKESPFIQLHKCGAGNSLGDRCDYIDSMFIRWFLLFHVVEAVSFFPYDSGIA